ncbi:hypothetical protein H1R20_g6328, partial [Candolleomyces eurysporus]
MSGNNFNISTGPPTSTAQQPDLNTTNDTIHEDKGLSLFGKPISGDCFEQPLNSGIDFSHMSIKQLSDLFQDTSSSVDFFSTVPATGQLPTAPGVSSLSNLSNWASALPTPPSTQPIPGPSTSNDGDIVGPWPLAPAIIPASTSTAANANDFGSPMLDPSAPSDAANANQSSASSQSDQTCDYDQLLRDIGFDPAIWQGFDTFIPESVASQTPIMDQPFDFDFDFGISDNDCNVWMQPSVENEVQSTTAAVNQTIAPALKASQPAVTNVKIPQVQAPQPLQPLFTPQFANNGANNVVSQLSSLSSTMALAQALYVAPDSANGSSSSSSMGMAAIGGLNTQATAGQSGQLAQRTQNAQAAPGPQQVQVLQPPSASSGPPAGSSP